MKVSGFTIVRNAEKLYFPIKESILSILPLVDEMIIALGDNDPDDRTEEIIKSIKSNKIKIYHRVWSEESFKESRILAEETNYALSLCQGDWCIYIQADEIFHEEDYPVIKEALHKHHHNDNVDGLLSTYRHFWGDYDHYLPYHGWYKQEIRIIKNHRGIKSIKDAQSFRKTDNRKLRVIEIPAKVYHYGWVRPPSLMQNKKKIHDGIHHGIEKAEHMYETRDNHYDYGALGKIPIFCGTHPKVMESWMKKIDWKKDLNFGKEWTPSRPKNKHEKFKYRLISWIENHLLRGKSLFGYSNWIKTKQ